MQAWEFTLRVRKRACENRLWALYDRYGNVVVERRRCPEMGPSWHKKDDVMAYLLYEMRREMEEIRFLRTQLRAHHINPLGKMTVVVKGEGHHAAKGPSIRELIERAAEKAERNGDLSKPYTTTRRDYEMKAEGLREALDIFTNPYRHLDEDEQAAWDVAESDTEAMVTARAGDTRSSQKIMPAGKQGPTIAQLNATDKPTNVVRRSNKND